MFTLKKKKKVSLFSKTRTISQPERARKNTLGERELQSDPNTVIPMLTNGKFP